MIVSFSGVHKDKIVAAVQGFETSASPGLAWMRSAKAGFFEVLPCDRDAFFVIFYCGNLMSAFTALRHMKTAENPTAVPTQDSLWLFHL